MQVFSRQYWEIFKNTCFEERLWTAASETFPWTFSYMNKQHRSEEDVLSKTKQKTQVHEEKNLPFHDVLYHFVFLYYSTAHQVAFTLHNKRWS